MMKKTDVWKIVYRLVILAVAAVLVLPGLPAEARTKRRLSAARKTMRTGQSCTLSLKGAPKKARAGKLKWTSGNKQIVSVRRKIGNRAVLKAKKAGRTIVRARFKGRTYKCRIIVKEQKREGAEDGDTPALNATAVELHYIEDYAVPYIGEDPTHYDSFQFCVTGTEVSVRDWVIEGDPQVKKRYQITDDGAVRMVLGNDFGEAYSRCTVKARLSDGTELTATVRGYDDIALYIQKVFADFKETYITDNMTEYEKMDRAAWYLSAEYDYRLYQDDWCEYIVTGSGDCMASRFAVMYLCRYLGLHAAACPDFDAHGDTVVRADGKVYLVTTGYRGEKPRYYQIVEMSRELFDRRNEKNGIDPKYIWED